MSPTSPPIIPHLHILCMDPACHAAITKLLEDPDESFLYSLPPGTKYTLHDTALSQHPASEPFDLIVSPANSYGRLDGAFDDAISRFFAPWGDYHALTREAQRTLYERYRGFAPPGTCTIVDIPEEWAPTEGTETDKKKGGIPEKSRNVWGTKWLALCPTMRSPCDTRWDREVIYECIWSLLCAVGNYNREVSKRREKEEGGKGGEFIESLLMTPLATGVGRVTPERWAQQAVLAIKHYAEACAEEDKWSNLNWRDIERISDEIETTWEGS